MKNKIKIQQHDQSDCGAACLASVMAHYDLKMPISRIRQITGTDKRGTNVLGLVEAAEKVGFACKGVKAVDETGKPVTDVLSKVPKPTIAHIINAKGLPHFVVIYQVEKGGVVVMDPDSGNIKKWTQEELRERWTGILVLLVPNEDFVARDEKFSILTRFWFLFKPHRFTFIQALIGSLFYTLLGLASSICVQKIIDYVIPDGNRNLLNLICICMILATVLSTIIGYLRAKLMMRSGILINSRLILGYYKHLLSLPQSFFDSMRSGELISRMGDAAQINYFINNSLLGIVINVFTVIVAFALMFSYYWKLAMLMLLVIPVYTLIFWLYNRINRKIQRKQMEDAAELEVQLVESINSSGTIKSFGIESFTNVKTENLFVKLTRTGWDSGISGLMTDTASNTFSSLFVTMLLWSGTTFVLDGIITPGELMSFHTLTGYFMGPIIALVGENRVYQNAKIAADRLFEIFDLAPEDDTKNMPFAKEQCGDIAFENVSFRYGKREEVLKKLSLKFRKGDVNAIVGESGSGKTTLISLLQKLYPIQEGRIFIGDMDLSHISSSDLRRVIGVVPQRVDLFNGTITDNILLDDYSPNWERFYKVCDEVGINEFTEKMPQGFQTSIGENGIQLSGGQRQRIAIARALYRDPEVLILDEATSSLDSESEKRIKNIVRHLKEEKKTVILIAHRLGTVMEADTIFILKNGTLIEQGTHPSLMKKGGAYAKLWHIQTQINDE